jgi:hypothetical protein
MASISRTLISRTSEFEGNVVPRWSAIVCLILLFAAVPSSSGAQLPRDHAELEQWIEDTVTPQGHSNWPWGSLSFNWSYRFELRIKNKCKTPESVMTIPDADLEPIIGIKRVHRVPPNTLAVIPAYVRTPPPGDFESELERFMDPQGAVHERWTSLPLKGRLFVDNVNEDNECFGIARVFNAAGFLYNIPGNDALISDCWTYWDQELRPPATWDCTEAFRGFALTYIGTLGSPEELADSAEWSWLPTASRIAGMSDMQLLEMKKRAEAQRLDTLSGGNPTTDQ